LDSRILYSACSFHMMSNKDCFDTYWLVNSGIVTMSNGAHYKITGIGNIRIKMFDGVVRTLCVVRHVPEVENNLISSGTLDLNGAMIVMNGQKSSKNIYKLLISTVVGVIASVEFDSDCIVLWHMWLGHISVQGILELHKRNLLNGVKICKLDFYKFCVLGK
jgi:hypothetical protein